MKNVGAWFLIVLMVSQSLIGCAQRPDSIRSAHVQPELYSQLSCEQISFKQQSASAELASYSDMQNSSASTDTALFWVGFLLFWPAWFGWAATDDYSADIARLKGESKALETSYMQRCLASAEDAQPVMEGSK